MIGMIQGEVLRATQSPVLILCASGVGYEINVPPTVLYSVTTGQKVVLYTIQIVRDNAIELYGFLTEQEKTMFLLLCRVPKIGAKTSMAVLGVLTPAALLSALINMDVNALMQVPGIGRKTAERALVELRDLAADYSMAYAQASPQSSTATPGSDAVSGLVALGYNPQEARRIIDGVLAQHPNSGTDELIRKALQQ